MKNLKICFLSSILLAQGVMAELPNVTGKELADLIKLQENRIQSFQIKYRLNSGKYSEKGELVPGVIIDCEYARDISKEHRFFHEKWVKEDLDRKYAYDGKTGTNLTLKLPDEPGRMYGKIMPEIPEQFSNQALWKPDWSGYGFDLEGYDTLSSAIRNALKVEVITEKSNGDELYKVMFEVAEATGEKIKFVDTDGATKWRPFGITNVAWLSPQMGFQAVKIEALNGWRGDKTLYVCSATDFREISPGIWFPYRIERYGSRRSRGSLIEIEDIAINEKASVVSRLEFPHGTHVEDEIAGIDYRIGFTDDYLDANIKENIEKVHSARDGEVVLPDYNDQFKQSNDSNIPAVEKEDVENQNISTKESDVDASSEGHLKPTTLYLILGLFVLLGTLGLAYHRRKR